MKRITRINTAAAILWASAFVLGGMILLQAGRMPSQQAHASMVSNLNGYTVYTGDSGRGNDANPNALLAVIDNRTEVLMVYEIPDARQSGMILRDGGSLQNLFRTARR